MIRTGTDELKGTFVITDDVNSENIEFTKYHYKKSILKIDKKFSMPPPDYGIANNLNSKTFSYIDTQINEMSEPLVAGETQLRNFKIKINYWCNSVFKEVINKLDSRQSVYITVDTTVTKHEFILLYWLYNLGANILIITKDVNKAGKIKDDVQLKIYNTNENLEYRDDVLDTQVVKIESSELNSIDDIESALYDKNSLIKLSVVGIDNYVDSCDFYGRIFIEANIRHKIKLVVNKFDTPTQAEINSIPRFKKDEHSYILETLLMFVNVDDKDRKDKLKECIKNEFNSGCNSDLKGTLIYNKLVYTVIVLNKLINSKAQHIVMYYNKGISKNDIHVLRILAMLDFVSLLVITPDKKLEIQELKDIIPKLEFTSSVENLEMTTVDSRDNATTTGAIASRIAQETLYNGELLGMYKPGQFHTCKTKLFSTAYEEIELWWNKELYNRPKFKADGIEVTLPVMFKVIKGVPDKIRSENYTSSIIQKYLYGNTLICRNVQEISDLWINGKVEILRGTDIHNTRFEEQKPFFTDGKLNKQRIKDDINYGYGFLSVQKQEFILSKIEELLNSDYIRYQDKQTFIDETLNVLLNLDNNIIRAIQWFEFSTDNPNLVITMTNEDMLSTKDVILLIFLHLCGFDILIFVPTCYKTLDDLVTPNFQYETHNIGYAVYNIDTQHIQLENKVQQSQEQYKKKGFLSRFFGKGE